MEFKGDKESTLGLELRSQIEVENRLLLPQRSREVKE